MLALMLRRHLPFILSATAATLFLALAAVIILLGPQRGDARALGDPSAPRPVAAAEPAPVGQPPVARPAALPPEALASSGGAGGAPQNLIEARMPDERFHPAALAAVQCAVGREVAHDPALDAIAIDVWRAQAQGQVPVVQRLINDHGLRVVSLLTLDRDAPPSADPCVFGGADLRKRAGAQWSDAAVVGVAAFPEPEGGLPVMTLVVVAR